VKCPFSGKRTFVARRQAENVATRENERREIKVIVYQCTGCKGYHLSTKKNALSGGEPVEL
jgi:hypothetical protein